LKNSQFEDRIARERERKKERKRKRERDLLLLLECLCTLALNPPPLAELVFPLEKTIE
jgi:hypothetical protein